MDDKLKELLEVQRIGGTLLTCYDYSFREGKQEYTSKEINDHFQYEIFDKYWIFFEPRKLNPFFSLAMRSFAKYMFELGFRQDLNLFGECLDKLTEGDVFDKNENGIYMPNKIFHDVIFPVEWQESLDEKILSYGRFPEIVPHMDEEEYNSKYPGLWNAPELHYSNNHYI